ncbi:MAG: DEAD/DEAH box helicase [Verrucomicrobia bacterium]|jgi:ATP-dependent DNA helicase RecQ|nr:DEAD/DEAH box helicase [Verrucomicrobiota bacterium]
MSISSYYPTRALELLRAGTQNPKAEFRDGQEAAIRHIVEGRGRLLVVEKTGWGKSSVYFIATKLLRENGMGPALLISPLLSLMRNQIEAARRMGVRAATIHSDNVDQWSDIETQARNGEVDILLISPERLANPRFQAEVLGRIGHAVSLLVIDEAHCISDWGHDFRPHYRLIEGIIQGLPSNLRLLATTATANNRVMDDLTDILGSGLTKQRGELGRPSLFLQTIRLPSQAERLAWLAGVLPALPGSGIIYTLTVRDAHRVAEWLLERGISAAAYTGQSGDARIGLEQALLKNEYKALVATTSLGMGFDKPDLAFVIHFQMPGSVVAYYQQVGRAGRALEAAYGVLLSGTEEANINDFFIESAFPSRQEVEQVLAALDRSDSGLSVPALLAHVNASKGRIEKALQLLSLESPAPVVKEGAQWMLTAEPLGEGFWQRAERLTRLRREEQQQMCDYVALESGHMEFLIHALDGEAQGYTPPDLPPLSSTVERSLLDAANQFLRRTGFPLEARKQWPTGGLPQMNVKGKIPEDMQAKEGKFLCHWGSVGWGDDVRKGKYTDGVFSNSLVVEMARVFSEWSPEPAPAWVTCIPSLRHPDLVPDFARRLAARLGLAFHPVIERTDDRPEQKEMANSSKQARNVDGALRITDSTIPDGPVLLIDDMVDSKWTLTVAAYLLKKAGSGEVFPMAIASTTNS